jgi:hypothetical protein
MRFYEPGNPPPPAVPVVPPRQDTHVAPAVQPAQQTQQNALQAPHLDGLAFKSLVSNRGAFAAPHFDLDFKATAPGSVLMPGGVRNAKGDGLKDGTASVFIIPSRPLRKLEDLRQGLPPYLEYLDQPGIEGFRLEALCGGDNERFSMRSLWKDKDPFAWLHDGHRFDVAPPGLIEITANSVRGITHAKFKDPPDNQRPRLPLRPGNHAETDPRRRPGELWIRLLHLNHAGKPIAQDLALFTVAPFLLCSNADQVETVYAVREDDEKDTKKGSNEPWIRSLQAACELSKVRLVPLKPKARDGWARDQVLLGYWSVPTLIKKDPCEKFTPGIVKCMREISGGLHEQLKRYAKPAPDSEEDPLCGIVTGIGRPEGNGRDYGGNVMVSPPVLEATQAVGRDAAGPPIGAHGRAPYGKIILGDGGTDRRPAQSFRAFLRAQTVQPIVRIHTEWLYVGHADEVVSFVPAMQTCAATGAGRPLGHNGARWAALVASMDLAHLLLRHTIAHGAGALRQMRRRVDGDDEDLSFEALPVWRPSESVKAFVKEHAGGDHLDGAIFPTHKTLSAIKDRVRATLNLRDEDLVLMPVLFDGRQHEHCDSLLPNTVNLLPLNGGHVIVPKPWGPRVSGLAAREVLCMVCDAMRIEKRVVDLVVDRNGAVLLPTLLQERVFRRRGAGKKELDQWIREWKDEIAETYGAAQQRLRMDVLEGPPPWVEFLLTHGDSVDVFEAYIAARFQGMGLTPIFVDDWDQCHIRGGEVHCGTNERRRPTDVPPDHKWWKILDELPFDEGEPEDEEEPEEHQAEQQPVVAAPASAVAVAQDKKV